MDKVLKDLGFLTEHPELYQLPRSALVATGTIDVQHFRRRIDAMRSHHQRSEHYLAGEVGAELLLAFLKAGIAFEKKELLPLWVEFLLMWAGTCTWLNLLNMPYDAVWPARMLRETYEAQEQWHSFNYYASLVSHTLYVQSCSINDEKLLLGLVPTGKKSFQKERRAIVCLQTGLEEKRQHSFISSRFYRRELNDPGYYGATTLVFLSLIFLFSFYQGAMLSPFHSLNESGSRVAHLRFTWLRKQPPRLTHAVAFFS